jgi:endonuclease/exonuclease/phosphatase family metal-dependent hydrolase
VLSVNLWNFNHWEARLPLLARELARLDADVVAVQEVRARRLSAARTRRFQVADLAQLLPRHQFMYAPAMTFAEGGQGEGGEVHSEGLAIFSRLPVLAVAARRLSRDPLDDRDFHQRIALRARVATPRGALRVINTHLSLSDAARARAWGELAAAADATEEEEDAEAEAAAGAAAPQLRPQRVGGEGAPPTVLAGDFNCELDAAHELFRLHGFRDAWAEAAAAGADGRTFNSWALRSRIDYVLLRGGVAARRASVEGGDALVSVGLAAMGGVDETRDLLFPSDHRFVLAELELTG